MLVSGEFSDELLAGSETFRNFVDEDSSVLSRASSERVLRAAVGFFLFGYKSESSSLPCF